METAKVRGTEPRRDGFKMSMFLFSRGSDCYYIPAPRHLIYLLTKLGSWRSMHVIIATILGGLSDEEGQHVGSLVTCEPGITSKTSRVSLKQHVAA